MFFNHYNDHNRPVTPQTRPKKCPEYRLAQISCQNFQGSKQTNGEIRWAADIALNQTESWRDTTDENHIMSQSGQLRVEHFSRGCAQLDTGTEAALIDAGNFVKTVEDRQGFIDHGQLQQIAQQLNHPYGEYLSRLAATV